MAFSDERLSASTARERGPLHQESMKPKINSEETAGAVAPVIPCSAWSIIGAAPKDGTRILAWFPLRRDSYIVAWCRNDYETEKSWTLDEGESATLNHDEPSHWMPIPPPQEASVDAMDLQIDQRRPRRWMARLVSLLKL